MLAPNTLLNGRYRIEKLIGQGGMGAVYKARAENLDITVAVKEATVTDTRLLGAFEKEAQRLARLRHPGLPRVIDHFVEGYGHYLVMEFIEGEDLGDKLQAKGQPLSVDEVLALGDQLLQVLDYLHRQQPAIIHRDIKPQNLKVMPDGSLILLDFGLAKGGLTQQNTYGSHSLFGFSIGYAPPEQMSAQGTDQRSDLYSVAATLWTLLTAQRAIDAQVREQAAKHGVPDPMRPANELNPHVPPLVAQALTRALALNPNYRPNSATEMRQQLQAEAERKRREQQQVEGTAVPLYLVPRVVQPPVSAPQSRTTTTNDQRELPPTNKITSFIPHLSPSNPQDHLRLLWWTLVTPQQLKAYRKQYGKNAERPVSRWLVSSLLWLPFLLPTFAVTVKALVYGIPSSSVIINFLIILVGWLFIGVFGDRESSQGGGVESKLTVILGAGLGIWLAGAASLVITTGIMPLRGVVEIALGVVLGLVLGVVLAVVHSVKLSVGVGVGLGVGLLVALGLLAVVALGRLGLSAVGGILVGGLAVGLVLGLGVVPMPALQDSLKTGDPSLLGKVAFGLLIAVYAFLVWFCFFA